MKTPGERKAEVERLAAIRSGHGAVQQLARLDERFGIGKGARKERRRLYAAIAEAAKP